MNEVAEPGRSLRGRSSSGAASGPAAMSRVLRLFDLLAARRAGMTLSEASEALGVPKSTLISSLKALVVDGFLIAEGGAYQLGPGAYRLAGSILAGWSMPDLMRPYVRGLADETHESVGFGIVDWELGQVIYTDGVNSSQPVQYAMRVGLRAPLHASAAGRVLLAYGPKPKVAEYMKRAPFKRLTPATLTTAAQLEAKLGEVRDLGYCASFGELLKDTAAIAVPVFDPNNEITGALMVGAPLERMRGEFDHLLAATQGFGRRASGLAPDEVASTHPSPM